MSARRAVLALLLFVAGCQSADYERLEILPVAQGRAAPTFSEFKRCLSEVFSPARMPPTVMTGLHEALERDGEVWFQVPVESSYGPYFRVHFVAYLTGPQVLVLGRVQKDESIDELGAWRINAPVPVAAPVQPAPKPSAPTQCPKCAFKKLLPTYKNCPGCNATLR